MSGITITVSTEEIREILQEAIRNAVAETQTQAPQEAYGGDASYGTPVESVSSRTAYDEPEVDRGSDRVRKFSLAGCYGNFKVEMPEGAEMVAVGVQHCQPVVWAKIPGWATTSAKRRMWMRGTGHRFPDGYLYVGTAQLGDGVTRHLFDGGWA